MKGVYIQTNEFTDAPQQKFFLKEWHPQDKGYKLVWTDNKKEAHNFKTLDNEQFLTMLDFLASEYWQMNITYISPKQ